MIREIQDTDLPPGSSDDVIKHISDLGWLWFQTDESYYGQMKCSMLSQPFSKYRYWLRRLDGLAVVFARWNIVGLMGGEKLIDITSWPIMGGDVIKYYLFTGLCRLSRVYGISEIIHCGMFVKYHIISKHTIFYVIVSFLIKQ